jgi:hypothetical protein
MQFVQMISAVSQHSILFMKNEGYIFQLKMISHHQASSGSWIDWWKLNLHWLLCSVLLNTNEYYSHLTWHYLDEE